MITKLGAETVSRELKPAHKFSWQPYIGGGEIVLGGGLIGSGLRSPGLKGRTVLYHGTSAENVPSILEEGFKPGKVPGQSESLRAKPEIYRNSQGKTYFTPDFGDAMSYADQSHNGKILKSKIPLHKFKVVTNPEVDMSFEDWEKSLTKGDLEILKDRNARRDVYNSLKKSVVIDGEVPPEYITQSRKYQKGTIRDVFNAMKYSPARFMGPAGRIVSGAGIAGDGVMRIVDYFSDDDVEAGKSPYLEYEDTHYIGRKNK